MFETLAEPKVDTILALMGAFRADERSDKLDLGVGIYKDAEGATPVMQAIKAAEARLHEAQTTKAYVSPGGSADFCAAMIRQVFGEGDVSRMRAVQSIGGSGALSILASLLHEGRRNARIWVSDPSWPNHVPLLGAAGFELCRYPYYDASTGRVDIDGMLAALETAREGDIVVLHGCCHNPTGADLSDEEWNRVIAVMKARSLFPFVDLAYQGFGDGLEQDAGPTRRLAAELDELVVAASCSKNFGVYRDRVGAALLVGRDAAEASRAHGRLVTIVRSSYSMPPDHGAATAELVLTDARLNQQWRDELESMRVRMSGLRENFAAALRKRSNSDRFDFIAGQKGMFSRLPLDTGHIERLRAEHGIYIVGDGRINIAGLPGAGLDALADKIWAVMSEA